MQQLHPQSSTSLISLTTSGRNYKQHKKHKWRKHFKLIDMYKQHECLWMENHKDFFNFALKEEIWNEIANQMVCHAYPKPMPNKWKQLVLTWRYKVQLEQLHEQEAKYYNTFDQLPPKLRYSENFQFLLKHMFDRKIPPAESENVQKKNLAAMRLERNKSKSNISYAQKLKKLEVLRNSRCGRLSLTPEAFHQLL